MRDKFDSEHINMRFLLTFAVLSVVSYVGLSIPASASTIFNSPLSAPGCYYGTGCVNSGFTVLNATNSDESTLQLGLSAIQRFVGPITPTGIDYAVPTGTSGGDALWDFSFSVNSGTDSLAHYVYSVTILDLLTAKSYTFDPTLLPDNAQVGPDACSNNAQGCTYNSANTGFQNAENLSFGFISAGLGGFNPNSTDPILITLAADPITGTALDPSVSIEVNPAAAPEPASLLFGGTGLLCIGLIGRRRR